MSDDLTVPAGTPAPDFRKEQCPHCDELIWQSRVDDHVTTVHADIPPCTATIHSEYDGLLSCVFRAGHAEGRGEYGAWHASAYGAQLGRHVWNDTADGATPHQGGNPVSDDPAESADTPAPGIGEIQLSRQLGRGVIVETAPARALIGLRIIRDLAWPANIAEVGASDLVNIADQVLYRVVGYDPGHASLIVELVEDWRPEPDPQPTPGFVPTPAPKHIPRTGDPAHTLVVEPYRNDRNQDRWVFRCWGTDTCDGWLSLDHTSQQWAEHARDRHVAEEHTKEQPMPTCTATIEGPHVIGGGPIQCTREAGHPENHVGPQRNGEGKVLWTDHNAGATPHGASASEEG